MNFSFTAEQQRFRREVAAFLEQELPPGSLPEEDLPDPANVRKVQRLIRKLAEKGWLCIGWPKEYGGSGWSKVEQAIFNEEMGYHHVPFEPWALAVKIVGPSIMMFGSEQLRNERLPAIASGRFEVYYQGLTEPDSGSDLASLKTRADQDGDEFVISGQKIYVGEGLPADYIFLAARTDTEAQRHRGISLFLVDMHLPGISVRPLLMLTGPKKNHVFFDNVKVPASSLIGELNKGWYHLQETLARERAQVDQPAQLRRTLDDLVALVRSNTPKVLTDQRIRALLADLYISLEVWRLLNWRIVWMEESGLSAGHEAAICDVFGKDLKSRFGPAIAKIFGPYALLNAKDPRAPMFGEIEFWLRESHQTHGGGTPEILRNVIAVRGLGLPR